MSYVLFGTVLAYISWRYAREAPALGAFIIPRKFSLAVVGIVLVVFCASMWFVNVRPYMQARTLLKALSPQPEGLMKNLELFKSAINYGTAGTQEAREQLVQAASQMAGAEGVPTDVKQAFGEEAVRQMTAQAESSPLDARFPLFLGVLYNVYGDTDNALNWLLKALELSPTKQTILIEIGNTYLGRGDMAKALEYYKRAYDLAPDFTEARLYYAAALIRANRDAEAEELLAPIVESGKAANPRIAAAYVTKGRYDKIAVIWEKRIAAEPNDLQAYFTLAAAYYQGGNSARAIAVLEKAGKISEAAKSEADALIQQIRQGAAQL
jgi:tetratricopeptide (TPR) repeat protein